MSCSFYVCPCYLSIFYSHFSVLFYLLFSKIPVKRSIAGERRRSVGTNGIKYQCFYFLSFPPVFPYSPPFHLDPCQSVIVSQRYIPNSADSYNGREPSGDGMSTHSCTSTHRGNNLHPFKPHPFQIVVIETFIRNHLTK